MYLTDPTGNITLRKAPSKGTCPICKVTYTRGTRVYHDKRKAEADRRVHTHCYHHLLWEKYKDTDPAPF